MDSLQYTTLNGKFGGNLSANNDNNRNKVIYAAETIQRYGKQLLIQDNSDYNSIEWLQKLDRIKVTDVTFGCLEEIFAILSLTQEEKIFILEIRKKENKRVSTAQRRRVKRQITESVDYLKKLKSELETEKAFLEFDILCYQLSSN